jgi:hypothetical protein
MSEKTKDWQPDPSVPATLTRAEAEERLSRLSPTAQAMGNLDNAYENLASFEACFVGGPRDVFTAWGILRAFVAGPDAPPRPSRALSVGYLKDVLGLPRRVGDYPALEGVPALTVHEVRFLSVSRWAEWRAIVFSLGSGPCATMPGWAWYVEYKVPITGMAYVDPWDGSEVAATLVRSAEKVVTVWEPVK